MLSIDNNVGVCVLSQHCCQLTTVTAPILKGTSPVTTSTHRTTALSVRRTLSKVALLTALATSSFGLAPSASSAAEVPGMPSIESGILSGAINQTNYDIYFDGDSNTMMFECSLDGGGFDPCSFGNWGHIGLNDLADGEHSFRVRAVGYENEVSDAFEMYWTVDTIAPWNPMLYGFPDPLTNLNSASIGFMGEDGASFSCSFDGGSYEPCGDSPKYLDGLTEGPHNLSVTQTDAAGNVGEAASVDWTVDGTAPNPPELSGAPSSTTDSTSASIGFTGEDGASFSCSVDGGDYEACVSPIDLSGLSVGSHSFSVKATDQAGNTGSEASVEWTVEASAPNGPPTVSNPISGASFSTSDVVPFSASAGTGATLECKLDSGDWGSCPISYTPGDGSTVRVGWDTKLLFGQVPYSSQVSVGQVDNGNYLETHSGKDNGARFVDPQAWDPDPSICQYFPGSGYWARGTVLGSDGSPTSLTNDFTLDCSNTSKYSTGDLLQDLAVGSHTLLVRATAGGVASDPVSIDFTIVQAPPYTYSTAGDAVSITGCAGTCPASLTLPSTVDGKPVTSIAGHAFENSSTLTSITIPEGVTNIGPGAFAGVSGVTSLTLPASLTSVDIAAFQGMTSLASVTFSEGSALTTIGPDAFRVDPALKSITLPASLTAIGSNAFYESGNLASVTFQGNAPTVGDTAFGRIASGAKARIGSPSLTGYGDSGDDFNGLVVEVNVSDAVLNYSISGSSAAVIGCVGTCPTSLEVPSSVEGYSVTRIDGHAFENSSTLQSITIPEGVTSIGPGAFAGASSITALTLPTTLTSVELAAFQGMSSLASVKFVEGGDGSALTTIGEDAFRLDSSLKSIVLPSNLTTIGSRAFYESGSLDSVTFEGQAPSIGDEVFYHVASGATANLAVSSLTGFGFNGDSFYGLIVTGGVDRDTTPPDAPELSGAPSSTTDSTSASIGFTGEDGASFSCSVDGGDYAACVSPMDLSGLSVGSHSFSVKATDQAGNTGSEASVEWTVSSPPFTYTTDNDQVTITGCNGTCPASLTIPATVDGLPVTKIGNSAFLFAANLTSVSLPDSVTVIEGAAFQLIPTLTSIDLGKGLVTIGPWAFHGASLTSLTLPSTLTTLGQGALNANNSLMNITVEGNAPEVGDVAIQGPAGGVVHLSSRDLTGYPSDGQTWYGYTVARPLPFTYTSDGTSVTITGCNVTCPSSLTIPASIEGKPVTSIGTSAFRNKVSLDSVTIPSGVTSIGSYAFAFATSLTSVTIPASVTSIGAAAFRGASALTSVTIPSGVTSIPNYAFAYATSLSSVSIPSSVTSIGAAAFRGASALRSVTIPNGVKSLGEVAFASSGLTSVSIPDSVTSVGMSAFEEVTSLTSVRLPAGLVTIPAGMFFHTGLTSVTIPSSVTAIGFAAFSYSAGLKTVTFQGNAPTAQKDEGGFPPFKRIAAGATATLSSASLTGFGAEGASWNGLTVVYPDTTAPDAPVLSGAPASLTSSTSASIGFTGEDGASFSCSVDGGDYEACVSPMDLSGLSVGSHSFSVKATDAAGNTGSEASVEWTVSSPPFTYTTDNDQVTITGCSNTCSSSVTIPETIEGKSVTAIGDGAFQDATAVTSVSLPSSLTTIGADAFRNTSIGAISIPDSVTTIGARAFWDAKSLTEITLPAGLSALDPGLFAFTEKLTSITLPASLKTIGSNAFWHSGISSISLPSGLETIDENAFSDTADLESVSLPSSLVTLGFGAFQNTGKLTSITLPTGLKSVASYAFGGGALTSINVPEGVTSIGDSAFRNMPGLETVMLPSTLTHIGANAFRGDGNLASVRFSGNAPTVQSDSDDGDVAFSGLAANATAELSVASLTGFGDDQSSFHGLIVKYPLPYRYSIASDEVTITGCNGTCPASLTIPASIEGKPVTTIGTAAFRYQFSLHSVTLPASVTAINGWAFKSTGLTSITIPAGVTQIGNGAFINSSSLATVTFLGNAPTVLDSGVFMGVASGAVAQLSSRSLAGFGYNGQVWNRLVVAGGVDQPAPPSPFAAVTFSASPSLWTVFRSGHWEIKAGVSTNGDSRPGAQPLTLQIATSMGKPSGAQPPKRPTYSNGLRSYSAAFTYNSAAMPRWIRVGNRVGKWTDWTAIVKRPTR